MNENLTPALIASALLSLVLEWFPGVSSWWQKQSSARKTTINALLVALISIISVLGGCWRGEVFWLAGCSSNLSINVKGFRSRGAGQKLSAFVFRAAGRFSGPEGRRAWVRARCLRAIGSRATERTRRWRGPDFGRRPKASRKIPSASPFVGLTCRGGRFLWLLSFGPTKESDPRL